MAKIVKVVSLIFALNFLSGCLDITFNAPDDEAAQVCRDGSLSGIPFSCERPVDPLTNQPYTLVPAKGAVCFSSMAVPVVGGGCALRVPSDSRKTLPSGSGSAGDGLIVFIETGTYEALRLLPPGEGEFGDLVASPAFPPILKSNLRTVMSNLLIAFLRNTFAGPNGGQPYAHIYFVRANSNLKDLFLQTLDKATSLHAKVDILMVGHGSPGQMAMDPSLQGSLALTANDLVGFAQGTMGDRRKNIRAIFQTNCFVFKAPPPGSTNPSQSIYSAYTDAFPNARFYGSPGVNTMPFQRDFVMFENYYKTKDFPAALLLATEVMKFVTSPSGIKTLRTTVSLPSLKAIGCVKVLWTNQCSTQVIGVGDRIMADAFSELWSSLPISGGVSP